jgi:hypothetical protein
VRYGNTTLYSLRLRDHRHGVEAAGVMYCCANCARQHGATNLADRA